MTRHRYTFAAVLASAILLSPIAAAPHSPARSGFRAKPATKSVSTSRDTDATLTAQKGKFRDTVAGKEVGSEEFEISSSAGGWLARGNATVKSGNGPETRITSQLQLTAAGAPVHYEWTTVTGSKKSSASVDFSAGTATIHLQVNGSQPYTQQFFFKSPNVAILDDNLYYQYAILAALYDWSARGVQSFSVLIPQELTPGTITVEALEPENSGGKNFNRLRVRSQDLEIILYLDGNRLEKIAVPSSNAEIIRQ
jgi:hypothetical protein